MPSYPEQQLLTWMTLLGKAETLVDLHLVPVDAAGVRTQVIAVTCTSLGANDRPLLGDRLPSVASGFALCRHLRRVVPPELIP